ncbi:MAG: hypothetical protein MZV70_03645 [Desulfobacterales bacterium]|nr:hypothetical protein [Desulfobacterales bacterium]
MNDAGTRRRRSSRALGRIEGSVAELEPAEVQPGGGAALAPGRRRSSGSARRRCA